eukprot:COSAG02_NODE_1366_length_13032_cov_721.428207_2_plen_76_part_00
MDNIGAVLSGLRKSAGGETVWVDMETSLREVREGAAGAQDIFAMDRAEKCSEIVIRMGFCGSDGGNGDDGSAANL